jgi:ferritin-like metal-binding protein YciE
LCASPGISEQVKARAVQQSGKDSGTMFATLHRRNRVNTASILAYLLQTGRPYSIHIPWRKDHYPSMSAEKMTTFDELFQTGLAEIYDGEQQLVQALPKVAQACSSPELRRAFEQHLQETRGHVQRLEQVYSKLGKRPEGKTNTILQAMTQEAEKKIRMTDSSPVRDAALIVCGNTVEHFEIGCYGSLRNFAELMGRNEIVSLLEQTLQEEKNADQLLTQIGESAVNPQAARMRGQLTT